MKTETAGKGIRERLRSVMGRKIQEEKNWPVKVKYGETLEGFELDRGWLVKIMLEIDRAVWGRWETWMRVAGGERDVGIDPIPYDRNPLADKMHKNCMESIMQHRGYDLRVVEYYVDWLLYAFGDQTVKVLPKEPKEGASYRLYRTFCLEAAMLWPYDYLGELLAEMESGKVNGFFPTPHGICEMMVQMSLVGDNRWKTFNDPCCGTGRLLLHAGNHTFLLSGQDVSGLVLKVTRVNGWLYVPWLVKPLPKPKMVARERTRQLVEVK